MIHYRKTRIAPTPSGFLHLGNLFSFSLTAALARQTGASILLRIDDLDEARVRREYVEDIFSSLRYLRIPWDEGPEDYREYEEKYAQRHRMALYRDALETLRKAGAVYGCDCSRKRGADPHRCREARLSLDAPGVGWRLRAPAGMPVSPLLLGEPHGERTLPASMEDFLVRKKDGDPAYQLTSVVDDDAFGVDLIVRGDDLWPSTLAQHSLAAILPGNGFGKITAWHHPLLTDAAARKLSKSAGATSVRFLRLEGMPAEEIFGRAAALAGSPEPASDFRSLAACWLPWVPPA